MFLLLYHADFSITYINNTLFFQSHISVTPYCNLLTAQVMVQLLATFNHIHHHDLVATAADGEGMPMPFSFFQSHSSP
jgi:hypothetical protein